MGTVLYLERSLSRKVAIAKINSGEKSLNKKTSILILMLNLLLNMMYAARSAAFLMLIIRFSIRVIITNHTNITFRVKEVGLGKRQVQCIKKEFFY